MGHGHKAMDRRYAGIDCTNIGSLQAVSVFFAFEDREGEI